MPYIGLLIFLLVDMYSFADLQKPQLELDGKPCAAVGQSGLMALYDGLLTQVRKAIVLSISTESVEGRFLVEILPKSQCIFCLVISTKICIYLKWF
jgi:hypothetical protein